MRTLNEGLAAHSPAHFQKSILKSVMKSAVCVFVTNVRRGVGVGSVPHTAVGFPRLDLLFPALLN